MPKEITQFAKYGIWSNDNFVLGVFTETFELMKLAAIEVDPSKKNAVDKWAKESTLSVAQFLIENKNNLSVLAYYFHQKSSGGYIEMDDDGWKTLRNLIIVPSDTNAPVSKGEKTTIHTCMTRYLEKCPENAKPNEKLMMVLSKIPLKNDDRKLHLFDSQLTLEKIFHNYETNYSPRVRYKQKTDEHNSDIKSYESKQTKGKKLSDKEQRRMAYPKKLTQIITAENTLFDSLPRVLAFTSTPIDFIKKDVEHYNSEELGYIMHGMYTTVFQQMAQINTTVSAPDSNTDNISPQTSKLNTAWLEFKTGFMNINNQQEQNRLKAENSTLKQEVTKAQADIIPLKEAMKSLQTKIDITEKNLQEIEQQKNQAIKEKDELLHKIRATEESIGVLESAKKALEMDKSTLQSDVANITAEAERNRAALVKLNEEMQKRNKEVSVAKAESDKLRNELQSIKTQQSASQVSVDSYEVKMTELMLKNEQSNQIISNLTEKNRDLAQELQNVKTQLEDLSQRVDATKPLQQSSQIDTTHQLRDEIDRLKQQLKQQSQQSQHAQSSYTDQDVIRMIDAFITRHKAVSDNRANSFGGIFSSAKHLNTKTKLLAELNSLKICPADSKHTPQYRLTRFTDLIEAYCNYLKENKSVRYLMDVAEFLDGERPDMSDKTAREEVWNTFNTSLDDDRVKGIVARIAQERPNKARGSV